MPGYSVTFSKDTIRLVRAVRQRMHREQPEKYPNPNAIPFNATFRWMYDRIP